MKLGKLSIDGGYNPDTKKMKVAWVLAIEGLELTGATEVINPYSEESSCTIAEYTALIMGLEEARLRNCSDVEIRSDNLVVVRQVEGSFRVRAPHLLPLKESVEQLLLDFNSWSIAWVSRRKNKEADRLANLRG